MKPWPRTVGVLDATFAGVLSAPGGLIVYCLLGWAGVGGLVAGLAIAFLALLAADGR